MRDSVEDLFHSGSEKEIFIWNFLKGFLRVPNYSFVIRRASMLHQSTRPEGQIHYGSLNTV